MEKTHLTPAPGKSLFNLFPNSFTGSTKIFFEKICTDADSDWWKGEIERITSKYEDTSEQVHRLAEVIRIQIVEQNFPEADNLYSPYQEILSEQIHSCDNYSIAKELLRQYKEKFQLEVA